MPLRIGNQTVGGLKIAGETVGGMKIGTEIIYSSATGRTITGVVRFPSAAYIGPSEFSTSKPWGPGSASMSSVPADLRDNASSNTFVASVSFAANGGILLELTNGDLLPAWETDGQVRFQATGLDVTVDAPDDTAEPYQWPANTLSSAQFRAIRGGGLTMTFNVTTGTPSPSGPRHRCVVTPADRGTTVGYNGVAGWGAIDDATYTAPNGSAVTIRHLRTVRTVLNLALAGVTTVDQFPGRVVSTKGANTVTWTRPSSVRDIGGGITRADYTTTDTIADVWDGTDPITCELFDS